ncbi:MAG: aminopeptidase P family protein [Oscillospiraceae bacterium]|jgi:Xaa-Pro aminopeptidase|nr:aminopeptidase P family protein [Oscillospiraceae bacterium]
MQGFLQTLGACLPAHAAALLCAPVARRFLTGFPSSAGILIVTRQTALFLTDSRYIEAARAHVSVCTVQELLDASKQLRRFCKAEDIRRVFLETESATLADVRKYRRWLPDCIIETEERRVDRALRKMRREKRPWQVDCIIRAQRIAEAAYAALLTEDVRAGITERELALALDSRLLRGGAEALSFETIVVAGENGASPHGVPSDRALRHGDLVTLDFGAVCQGWHSDMTRTFALGAVCEAQRNIFETVLTAQKTALDALRPGLSCKEADDAARRVVEQAGYGEYFRHGTGHGVGLEIHEAPVLSPKSKDTLAPGDVVTVEPGIYVPGVCGVRIEDMALITENGSQNLTLAPKEFHCVCASAVLPERNG